MAYARDSRNPTRRANPNSNAPQTPAPRTSKPDYRNKTPEEYAREMDAWRENQKVDPRIVTYNPYTGVTTYKDDRGRLITVRGEPTQQTAAQFQQEYKQRVGTSTVQDEKGKTMTISGYVRQNPTLLSSPSEDRVREAAIRIAQSKSDREFKEELTREGYYHKPIERLNKETGVWETVYRKMPSYQEVKTARERKEEWYKRAGEEVERFNLAKQKKSEIKAPSGTLSAAPTSQKILGFIRKKDPKLAESISAYRSNKQDAPFVAKLVYAGAESYILGAGVGTAVGFVAKGVSFIPKAYKVGKVLTSSAFRKTIKFGSSAIIGYEANREFNIAKQKTGKSIEGYKASTIKLTSSIGFIKGFGSGYQFSDKVSSAVSTTYKDFTKPYKIKKFTQKMQREYDKLPKFQYIRKEPIFSQRTLQGGTISQDKIQFLRKPIYTQGYSDYVSTGQTTLAKPKTMIFDKWQYKFIKVSSPPKTLSIDKGRYLVDNIYPSESLLYRQGRFLIKSDSSIRSAFTTDKYLVSRPQIIRKSNIIQKELKEFGISSPLKKTKITQLRDMITSSSTKTTTSKNSFTGFKKGTSLTKEVKTPTQILSPVNVRYKPSATLKITSKPYIKTELKKLYISIPKIKRKDTVFVIPKIESILKERLRYSPLTKSKIMSIPKQDYTPKLQTKQIPKTEPEKITETTPRRITTPDTFIPSFPDTPTPTPTPPQVPPPIITPFIIPFSSTGRRQVSGLFKYKQPKKYRPTLFSAAFKIKGKPTRAGSLSGLGIRPISSIKTKIPKFNISKAKKTKLKMPKFSMQTFKPAIMGV